MVQKIIYDDKYKLVFLEDSPEFSIVEDISLKTPENDKYLQMLIENALPELTDTEKQNLSDQQFLEYEKMRLDIEEMKE